MARILQIRRGTTAQNDNFTGLSGELSFDTDAKTLRVHDGEMLGGFALARADQVQAGDGTGGDGGGTAGDAFDINSVPAEFWENIIANYAPPPIKVFTGKPSIIMTTSYIEHVLNLSGTATFARAVLVCQTPEAGYSVGDEVAAFGVGSRTNPLPITFSSEYGIHARLLTANEGFWVSHKTTGAQTPITNEKWNIKFTIWY